MGKKILKIVGVILFLVIALLIAAPFILEAKIGELIKTNVNQNINATLDFAEADLSLFSSFPDAEVSMKKITLINKAPFEGDTLFSSDLVQLRMGIRELFKSAGEPIAIQRLFIDGAKLNIRYDEAENANYDIAKDTGSAESSPSGTEGFTLDMQSYEITNSNITYDDRAGGMLFNLYDIHHSGTGDLSLEKSQLQTLTEALVSFEMDSTNYLNKNKIKLDALIGIDLEGIQIHLFKERGIVEPIALGI